MKAFMIAFVLLFTGSTFLAAQDETQLNRWSFDISGGFLTGVNKSYIAPFSGSLGIESQPFNPYAHLGFRYSFSPVVSLRAGFGWARLNEDVSKHPNNPYTTQMLMVSIEPQFYFLRVFETYRTTRMLNPYILAGIGRSFVEITDLPNDQSREFNSGFLKFGIGTKINVSDRVDMMLQYEYHAYRNNGIDGYNNISGNETGSRLGGITLGVSVKLGSSQRPHADWHLGDSRFARVERLSEEVREQQDAMRSEINRSLNAQDSKLAGLERRVETLEERRPVRLPEDTETKIEDMNQRIQQLEEEVRLLRQGTPATTPGRAARDGITVDVPAGFYIQVFSGSKEENSRRALGIIRELFEDVHGMTGLNYVLHKPGNYYVVQIGPYSRFGDTGDILMRAREVFDDSFVIQYK